MTLDCSNPFPPKRTREESIVFAAQGKAHADFLCGRPLSAWWPQGLSPNERHLYRTTYKHYYQTKHHTLTSITTLNRGAANEAAWEAWLADCPMSWLPPPRHPAYGRHS